MALEELLNKLIKRCWQPFGWGDKLSSLHKEYEVGKWYIRFHNGMDSELFDLRQLTSKESGLWQFVCENGMIRKDNYTTQRWTHVYEDERDGDFNKCHIYSEGNNEYRLIESSLKDESELEQFLLDNILIH